MTNYAQYHVKAALRVLCYLKGTPLLALRFRAPVDSTEHNFHVYSDSDWGTNKASRRSVSGSLSFLYGNVLMFRTKMQPTVALSSTEAEYMAMSDSLKEIKATRMLLYDTGAFSFDEPTILYGDNKGALDLCNTLVANDRTKHIDLRYHALKDAVLDKLIVGTYVPTDENTSDFFTKPLDAVTFVRHRDVIMFPVPDDADTNSVSV
jgi:hypothetical protein